MSIRPANPDDVLRWPDGSWCYRHEHCDHADRWRGDDFEVMTPEHPEYDMLISDAKEPTRNEVQP